jgi:zinc finger SWIM domain-containing protein 3
MAHGEAGSMLKYFEDKTKENPSFQYVLQKDCDGQIANIFWADAKMVIDYAHFGDVITFDTTFGTNKESRPFGVFVGFNHFREMVIFGASLMYDETFASFHWLFDTFLKAHNGKQPKTVFTDQDSAMGKAVEQVFTEAWHGLCTFHISQNALKHLHEKEILKDFSACMFEYADQTTFEDAFNTIRSKVEKQTWLDSIYKLKEKWAACFMKDIFTLGMRSTQLSESLNSDLKEYLKSNLDIIRFLKQFERVVQGKRNKELDSTFDSRKKFPRIKMRTSMLLEASKLYTPIIFEVFQDEYERSMRACSRLLDEPNKYRVTIENLDQKPTFEECEVIGNPLEQSVICTCSQFSRIGILCGHALKVLDSMNIKTLPTQYILKRWTREARHGTIQDNHGRNITENPMLDSMLRSRLLSHKFHSLTDQVAGSLDCCLLIDSTLDILIKQVEEKMHACRITLEDPCAGHITNTNVEVSNDLMGIRLKKKEVRTSTSRRKRTWLDKKRMPRKKNESNMLTALVSKNDSLTAQITSDSCSRYNNTSVEEYGVISSFTQLVTVILLYLNVQFDVSELF